MNGLPLPVNLAPYLQASMGDRLAQILEAHDWDFFGYSAVALGLAPGLNASPNIPIQSDSRFLIMSAQLTARDNAATDSVIDPAPLTVQISDSGSGRSFWDRAQDVRNVCGVGSDPCWWPYYRLVEPGSSLAVTFTSLEPGGGTTLDVRLTLHGVKIFQTRTNR